MTNPNAAKLDVTIDRSVLTFNMKGNVEPYEADFTKPDLFKETDL